MVKFIGSNNKINDAFWADISMSMDSYYADVINSGIRVLQYEGQVDIELNTAGIL